MSKFPNIVSKGKGKTKIQQFIVTVSHTYCYYLVNLITFDRFFLLSLSFFVVNNKKLLNNLL